MLTQEQNDTLTRVGPGTRMGNLMRRYWHPVAATVELRKDSVKAIRLLGESLVLYRDEGGQVGLVAEASVQSGSLDQPSEPAGRTPMPAGKAMSYPVQELGGLIFAYLGPGPLPLLPRYNVLVWDDALRETNGTVIACNWLQVMENLLDPMHVENLHGRYFAYVLERKGGNQLQEFLSHYVPAPMKKIGFDLFEHGIIERHVTRTDEDPSWKSGTPSFFPTTSLLGSSGKGGSVIFVVPVDDTHTWFLLHVAERLDIPILPPESSLFFDVPGTDEAGKFILDTANGQDHMAVVTQGEIARRDQEHLGMSDMGIVLYRELLMEQIERVERGDDPMNVCREPAKNQVIEIPVAQKVAAAAGELARNEGGISERREAVIRP